MTYSDDYLAGLFDGEGSISAYLSKTGGWVLRVQLGMTSGHLVRAFYDRFGGGLHERKKPTKSGLTMHEWYLAGGKSVGFLEWAIKNCHEKDKQAAMALPLALQLREYRNKRAGKRPSDVVISQEDFAERTEIAEKLRAMNGARSRFTTT